MTAEDVLGYAPTRERALELTGVLALQASILLFGFSLGATWVGSSVSMAGCGVIGTATGPCSVLGGIEAWTQYTALASAGGFLLAVAIEHYQEDTDSEGDDSRTAVKSDGEVTSN